MLLNLSGVPVDLPLYDREGSIVYKPPTNASEEVDLMNYLMQITQLLESVDDIGTDLKLTDTINAYEYESEPEGREYYSAIIYGGKNGSGIWSNYLKVLSDLMLRMEDTFEDAWIRQVDIDVPDDVFLVEVAFLPYN